MNFCSIFFANHYLNIKSNNSLLLEHFRFVMREYLTDFSPNGIVCDLDSMNSFPPPEIKQDYYTTIGAAFQRNGLNYLILSPPYTGKTSFILQQISLGAKLISDDLILINRKNYTLLPIMKPICIRKNAAQMLGINDLILKENKVQFLKFEDQYGKRFILHPFDYFHGSYVISPVDISEIFVVSPDGCLLSEFLKLYKGGQSFTDIVALFRFFKEKTLRIVSEMSEIVL